MSYRRFVFLVFAGTALIARPYDAPAQHRAAGFDPVGEYTVESSTGDMPLTAVLEIAPDDTSLLAHFRIPGQMTLAMGSVRVDARTVTLEDHFGAVDISLVLRFEADNTFTGTWSIGPDNVEITGRRGADPALLPEWPRCADGPGQLPLPAPIARVTPDPDAARIVTSDVTLFWEVLDSGREETLAARLHCDYLRRGTDAVRDLIPMRIVSGERLAETVTTRRERYDAARQSSLTMGEMEPEIRSVFHAMKARYPDAVFPDVYFVVGRLNTGGTVSQRGLLIGAEMYSDHSGVVPIVAHELVHYQQRPISRGQRTLLAQSIMEGSADFVTELIVGDHINHRAHEYGLPRERELWDEFVQIMHGNDYAGWLYGSPTDGRPADLGYFIGYRITQAYYARAGADDQALREILNVTDYAAFLQRSGYDPSGTTN